MRAWKNHTHTEIEWTWNMEIWKQCVAHMGSCQRWTACTAHTDTHASGLHTFIMN